MTGYYYCSVSTFLNIIKSKQVYLSDPLKMNDQHEIFWSLNKLIYGDQDQPAYHELNKVVTSLGFTLDDLQERIKANGQHSIYIICFSDDGDSLSQWRAYGDNGKGVCIGFNLDQLESSTAYNFKLEKVKYTNSISANDIARNHSEDWSGLMNMANICFRDDPCNDLEILLHDLIPLLAMYKNPAFKEEREYRLIYRESIQANWWTDHAILNPEDFTDQRLPHDFRLCGDNNITEFVKLELDPSWITDICIGPKCALTEHDVLSITKTLLNITPTVRVSASGYR